MKFLKNNGVLIIFLLVVAGVALYYFWVNYGENQKLIAEMGSADFRKRIEEEIKLTVPLDGLDIFNKLASNLREGANFKLGDATYKIKTGEEFFLDKYYDTKDLELYKNHDSYRLRQRFVPGEGWSRTIQFKETTPTGQLETKHEIKDSDTPEHIREQMEGKNYRITPLLAIKELLKKERKLYEILTITQIRDRFYFVKPNVKDSGGQPIVYFTVTFDKSFVDAGQLSNKMDTIFVEIEIELNEKIRTNATDEDVRKFENQLAQLTGYIKSIDAALTDSKKLKYEKALELVEILSADENNLNSFNDN